MIKTAIDLPKYKDIKGDLLSYINSLDPKEEKDLKREMREYMIKLSIEELDEMLK